MQMSESAEKCLNTWQKLKRYITEAYPSPLVFGVLTEHEHQTGE